MKLTADQLSAISGVVLSLIFSYVPGLKSKFDALDPTQKRVVMLVLLAVVSIAIWLSSCNGWFVYAVCDQAGLKELITIFVLAMVANQSTFLLSPKRCVDPDCYDERLDQVIG
jgi:hypothetical protein